MEARLLANDNYGGRGREINLMLILTKSGDNEMVLGTRNSEVKEWEHHLKKMRIIGQKEYCIILGIMSEHYGEAASKY